MEERLEMLVDDIFWDRHTSGIVAVEVKADRVRIWEDV